MSNKQPSDYQVRQRAIAVEQSFLVEAPAGSGKTELLTDRILALLAYVERPEDIVAITFTRKAAAEMHQRVMEKLQAGQQPAPTQAYQLRSWQLAQAALARDQAQGWELLNYPARLSIRTIDSLCAHLVQAMPWASRLGGVPAITEDALILYEQAAQNTLLMMDRFPAVEQLLRHLNMNFARAEELIVDMLGKRDQWLDLLGHTADTEQLEHNLQQLVNERLQALSARMPLGWAEYLAPLARFACAQLQDSDRECRFLALAHWQGEPFAPHIEDLERWQALAHFLLTDAGQLRSPRGVTVRLGFPAQSPAKQGFADWLEAQALDAAHWTAALDETRLLPAGYDQEQREILHELVQVLKIAAADLQVVFAEQRTVDFIEVSQRALSALGSADDPTDLLLRLDRRIQHLLVDEFQDTSLVQHQILERLVSGWERGDGRTVFLVGDPMQSIYRFRKAEVGLFLEIKQQCRLGEVPLEVLQLKENFRSHPSLVAWVNRVGPEILARENDSEFGAVAFYPAQAFHEGTGEQVRVHDFWCWEDKELNLTQKQGLERAHQQQTEQAVIDLCQQALQTYGQSKHPAGILVRNRNHLSGLVRTLTQAGIACRAVELDPLESRPAVLDLVQLVQALTHPGDRLAWLALLRSPLCGLRLQSIYTLCAGVTPATPLFAHLQQFVARGNDELESTERLRLLRFINALRQYQNRSGVQTFASRLQHCWQALEGPGLYPHPTDREDVEQVFRLLDELAPYGQLDLGQFRERLGKLYAAAQNVSPAVEIMTIHKAKGLEFESVILYGLHRESRANQASLLNFEVRQGGLIVGPITVGEQRSEQAVAKYLQHREKQREAHELRRLLYVALTRARSEMHIVANLRFDGAKGQAKPPVSNCLLAILWPQLQDDTTLPAEPPQVAQSTAIERPEDIVGNHVRRLSPEALQQEEILRTHAQLQRPRRLQEQWHWEEPTQDESAVGQVAHAWLERIARDGVAHWPVARVQQYEEAIKRQLLRAGCSANALVQAAHEVQDAVIHTLRSRKGQWLLEVAQGQREWSLLDYQGRVSIIDLAIDQQDHWLIVDYKTTVPWPDEPLAQFSERMRLRHREQLLRYCQQVSALDGRTAKAALFFPRIDHWIELEMKNLL